ncbi:two-component system, OmpR family, sensor histidine kinase MprB [Thermomonospora echinospora]|uniref:histidine kinase n=1 Tax=Thermomonospora echinospora TaxID=1992 RepID=A0A1H6DHG4_9ACTN|nr:HAMP domain-containing sensor histidine kinase [Thermomonospora echinospora]SEG84651.1 two-component system, OmpR family, sensor histidine kinase MprB [Thermomonospora echinospora]
MRGRGTARRLTLRSRLALLTALAVALAVAGCAVATWFLTRAELYRRLDQSLGTAPPRGVGFRPPPAQPVPRRGSPIEEALADCQSGPRGTGETTPFRITLQAVLADGRRCTVPDSAVLVVEPVDVDVAAGRAGEVFHDGRTADGTPMRIHTRADPSRPGVAISVASPLAETEKSLSNLALLLAAVAAVGVLGAASAGLLVARAGLRPVDRLTRAVEHVARTQDLDVRIPVEGADEIARLSRSFNMMNAALAGSRDRQQQLIADAGHELRTPLTSLRTNIDLLMRSEETGRRLPPDTRRRLLASVRAQMRELTDLVGDLLELSRPARPEPSGETVALHEVLARALRRARLRGPGLQLVESVEPWFVHGDAGSLERAVVNLLDNAVKFSPAGGTVRVRLGGGELTVHDEGPGIAPQDLPHVFDRFWRSPSARSLPGSGLGLSIVARVVAESGGRVRLEPAPGGGTVARMFLPGAPVPPAR